MCCCHRADLRVGAYLTSPSGLFRVHAVRPGKGGVSEALLTDESEPLDTERVPEPDDVGGPAAYRVVEPDPITVPVHRVLRDFDLLRPAAHPDELASEREFGRMGIAPT